MGNLAYELVDGEYGPLSVCQELYRKSNIFPGNGTFDVNPRTDKGTRAKKGLEERSAPPLIPVRRGLDSNPDCLAAGLEAEKEIILIASMHHGKENKIHAITLSSAHRLHLHPSHAFAAQPTWEFLLRFRKVIKHTGATAGSEALRWLTCVCVCVCRLLSVKVAFTLKTINLQTVRHHELPDCYDFHITVGVGGQFWWLSLNMAGSQHISVSLSLSLSLDHFLQPRPQWKDHCQRENQGEDLRMQRLDRGRQM